jgi:ATP-dependent DNA ligase
MWDILRTPKGSWMFKVPYRQRRLWLEQFYNICVKGTAMEEFIHITDIRYDNKKEYFESLIASGKEGVVLKDLNSFYIMGKKPMWQWMKLKQKDEADLILTGYKEPKVDYNGKNIESWQYWREIDGILRPVTKDYYMGWIGALELSAYINGTLTFVCYSSGLNENQKAMIKANADKYIGKVCKITYMEKTEKGVPRHPRFEMFHESKLPTECTWKFNEVE